MTSQLVRTELGRPKLEATCFAQAVLEPGHIPELLEQLDPVRVSPALLQLLERLERFGADDLWCDSKAQEAIFDRAGELTFLELRGIGAWSKASLVALLNQLPPVRRLPDPAWHRRLDEGLAASADTEAADVAGLPAPLEP